MGGAMIAPITNEQISAAGGVLARAFHVDPLTTYMVPDPEARAQALPVFYEAAIRLAQRFGEAIVTTGEIAGAALWFPPGTVELGPKHFEAVGAGNLGERLPIGAFDRFGSVMEHLDGLRSRDVPGPHWYLAVLGVEPLRQGRGIGSALVRPIFERADSASVACYLETQKSDNVPLYRHLGFEVVVEPVEPKSRIQFWTMLRRPRR